MDAEMLAGFSAAMRKAGLSPPDDLAADGKLRRFHAEGDRRGSKNGWYVLHGDGVPTGVFGSWKTGITGTWCAKAHRETSPLDLAAFRERAEEARRRRDAEQRETHAKAREKAARLWERGTPADPSHPYLTAKAVKPHGIRQLDDTLLVPVHGPDGTLRGVQRIRTDGEKRYMAGTEARGGYHSIGEPSGVLVVAEGYATAASIHEATNHAVVVAFSCGNLHPVAEALRAKYPDVTLILAADDDRATKGNPGVRHATEAARAVSGLLAVPEFEDGDGTDFNDLAALRGPEDVRAAIGKAEAPPSAAADSRSRLEKAGATRANLGDEPDIDIRRQALDAWVKALDGASELEVVQERGELVRLGISAREVDAALSVRKKVRGTGDDLQGQSLTLADPKPWPTPVDGAALLNEIAHTFTRYLALPDGAADTMALWTVHAHAHDASDVSPLLALTSATKQCGKTTALHVLSGLVPRPLPSSNVTPAVLFRAVEAYRPTLLVDEADTFLREREELRGVLNAGHHRAGAVVLRAVGDNHEPRAFSTWCPKAVALIGRLPDTLEDRSIEVRMRRRAPGEKVDRLRLDRLSELEPLRRKAARWAADNADALSAADPDVPEGFHDRAADNARPLLSIADAAGGEWPERARAALETRYSARDADDGNASILLLADLRELFTLRGSDRLASQEIVAALVEMEHRPWPEWRRGKPITQRGVARLLGDFEATRGGKVRPGVVRLGPRTARGYRLADLEDAFARYLPASTPPPNRNNRNNTHDSATNAGFSVRNADRHVTDSESTENPHGINDVADVTDGEGGILREGVSDTFEPESSTPNDDHRPDATDPGVVV